MTRETQGVNDEINGILNETLSVSGQLLVKLFGREARELRRNPETGEEELVMEWEEESGTA